MADYNRKQYRFVNNGMAWSRSVDTIPEDKVCFARNVRSYQTGTATSRPGTTLFTTLAAAGDNIHSIARLNNLNTALFGSNWDISFILGSGAKLYVGKDNTHLTNAVINPVSTPLSPLGFGTAFSGNPLTMVDAQPSGSEVAWKYIADSLQMCAVGYYPGDNPNTNVLPTMARCITMGLLPPVTQTVPITNGAGTLNGTYQWVFAFRRTNTGARSNPSAATRVTVANPGLVLTNQQAQMTLPTTPIDPQTGAADTNVVVDVYRFGGTIFRWALVGSGASGATFNDNLPDSSLNVAPGPPQLTDPITGLVRFNLFQPFTIPDIGHFGTGTLSQNGAGKWIFTWTSGDKFNLGWLPGSSIGINNAPLFTIYQVLSTTVVELSEDATRVGAGAGYPYAVYTGTLAAGTPVNHIWGPWGTGQTGSYIFGVGNNNAPGTLFWTNGNDPDSCDIAGSLLVTDPSEPLIAGCVYQGVSYVWSSDRMFQIYPSTTIPGQFLVQEVPGGKGIYAPYSLTVQANGISDMSVSWIGKDGIYNYSLGGGLQSLTGDDLYPYFIHDNQGGKTLAQLFPFLSGESIGALDFSSGQINNHRLCWFDGYLFYDSVNTNIYCTFVFDSRISGWVSLDEYPQNGRPMSRGIEIDGNNLKIGIGNKLYDYTGASDDGTGILCRLVTLATDHGDGRTQKLYGDVLVDADPGAATLSPKLLTNLHGTSTSLTAITTSGRQQIVEDFASGGGLLGTTVGLDITWTASSATVATLYQWEIAYVPKPEITVARATDWDDLGYEGAKFVQGFILQANTFNQNLTLTVQSDGGTVQQTFANVNHNGELEIAYSFSTPFITHQVRVTSSGSLLFQAPFRIRWIFEPAPELARNWITQTTSHGLKGYIHHRDGYIAIQSTDIVILRVQADGNPPNDYVFPSTGGLVSKPYTPIAASKGKLVQYSVFSCTPFRLFQKDCEIRVKAWGQTGEYQTVRPFGDLSFENGARI